MNPIPFQVFGINLLVRLMPEPPADVRVHCPKGSPIRYGPRLKITGWTGGSPLITWGVTTLKAGTDYNARVDATSTTLFVQLLFDVVEIRFFAGRFCWWCFLCRW